MEEAAGSTVDASLADGGKAKDALSDDDVDSEAGDSLITFDYAALEEAQRIASQGLTASQADEDGASLKRKQRGGCRESKQRRKKQRREDDVLRAKQAGIAVPSLKDILAGTKAKEAAASSASGTTAAKGSSGQVATLAGFEDVKSEASSSSKDAGSPDTAETQAEVQPPAQPEAGSADDPRTAAAVKRLAKENARRALVAQAQNARTVFVTNLPFKTTEQEISEWLGTCGNVRSVRLSRDKATTKSLGYAHVQFESPSAVEAAIEKCDRFDVQGRVVRISRVSQGESFKFDLPEEIKNDIRSLMQEFEGRNLSMIKDAWQKRHPGEKLKTEKWGFKNFSTAMRTVEGVCLEHHAEKTLTYLAFFQGSPAHVAFVEEKRRREETASAAQTAVPSAEGGPAASAAGREEAQSVTREEEAATAAQTADAATERRQEAEAGADSAAQTADVAPGNKITIPAEGEVAAHTEELTAEGSQAAAVQHRKEVASAQGVAGVVAQVGAAVEFKVDKIAVSEPPTKQRRLDADSHDEASMDAVQGDAVMA